MLVLQGTAPMQIGGNRNAKNITVGADGKRDWSFGLFDCFPRCSLCCQAVCCPCIVYSKNRQRLRHLQQQGAPLPGGGERYDDYCLIYSGLLILTGHAWILHIHTRTEARERYGIRGDTYGDCLTAWCCRPCSLTQERREIELEEGSFEQSDK
ncbi:PLAC8 family-domain-containing protein [Russula ochroleuca]|uniref:PLAC8 family-domain-containing protein n=1 Tax=Russula ochroleuca TaxID=152965 RepID=A0A9P5MP75_9AGAM|nr:PLAC8 family-domain-containing protein [Russula ochroleuca]